MVVKRGMLILVLALGVVGLGMNSGALASVQIPNQVTLDPTTITKYQDTMPTFGPNGTLPRQQAGTALAVSYHEFQQKVLPNAFYGTLPTNVTIGGTAGPPNFPAFSFNPQLGTWVWGYKVGSAPQLFPGVTVEAQQGVKTKVTYNNTLLGSTSDTYPILQRYITIDQSIHWANPNNLLLNDPTRFLPYSGPQPVVAHLHGSELRSDSDGGPDEWWTPGGEGPISQAPAAGAKRGPGYKQNVYTYYNTQETTTLWFHEHPLGITRTNVYGGLAAFWFIRNIYDNGTATNLLHLPADQYEREIVFQDRQFDTNGQLFWPDGTPPSVSNPNPPPPTVLSGGLNGDPPNPTIHPFWIPEFFGDVIVVNGKSWPKLQVEPRRYRFRLLDGSNARFYYFRLGVQNTASNPQGPPIYVIGTDGGLLDRPAITSSTPLTFDVSGNPVPGSDWLLMAPGERYDVIIDFSAFAGQNLTLYNYANGPFPDGDGAYGETWGNSCSSR